MDFSSGFVNSLGDYEQSVPEENVHFIFQWIYDPKIVAELDSGRVVWKTEEVYFQWVTPIRFEPYHFFHEFRSIKLEGAGRLRLTFAGDNLDTLRVDTVLVAGQPWTLFIPDSLFNETTQVHAWGFCPLDGKGEGLKVDDVDLCSIPN